MKFVRFNIIYVLCTIFIRYMSTLDMPQVYHHETVSHTAETKWSGKSLYEGMVQSSSEQSIIYKAAETANSPHTLSKTIALLTTTSSTTKPFSEVKPYFDDETRNTPLNPMSIFMQTPFVNSSGKIVEFSTAKTSAKTAHYIEEGNFCRRSFDGRGGYCVLAYLCLHAINDYRLHGTYVDICTYWKNIPVVCCPLSDKQNDEQRISAQKCKEYHKPVRGIKLSSARSFSGKMCVRNIPLIVGGEIAKKDQYPHMAALGWTQADKTYKWNCGGTLISDLFVLTAAHCTTSDGKPPDMVRLGAQNLNSTTRGQQDIKILIIILHPKYHFSSYYHDIALLKLEKRAEISVHIQPACLWQLSDLPMTTATATGWGRTDFDGPRSNELKKVDLNIIDHKICKDMYLRERRFPQGLTDGQLCAGNLEGGMDTCQGDSGGPLHAELPEFHCVKFVIGITSFGKFCAEANAPGVYTKIYTYLDWIEKIVFRVVNL